MTRHNEVKELYRQAMSEFVAKKYKRAIALFTEALAIDPGFAMGFTGRGAAFLQQDMAENAIVDFDRAISAGKSYPKAFHLRGLAKERLGDHVAAMEDFNRAIELDPEYGAAYFSRANLNVNTGKPELALEDMEMVAQLTNANLEAFANDNNIWRSRHLQMEDAIETEMQR